MSLSKTGRGDERHGPDLFPGLLFGSPADVNGGRRGFHSQRSEMANVLKLTGEGTTERLK